MGWDWLRTGEVCISVTGRNWLIDPASYEIETPAFARSARHEIHARALRWNQFGLG
jgi:hypothetical protein